MKTEIFTDIHKYCKTCGKLLTSGQIRRHSVYCCRECYGVKSQQHHPPVHHINPNHVKMAPGTTGSISEYIVSIDLLRKGYEVFKSVSSHASCDLICHRNGVIKRIEVKTGYYKDGIPTLGYLEKMDDNRYDILAIVTDLNEIRYVPGLP